MKHRPPSIPTPLTVALGVAIWTAGCGGMTNEAADPMAGFDDPTIESPDSPPPRAHRTPGSSVRAGRAFIAAADATKRDMPAVSFVVEWKHGVLTEHLFPEPNVYLQLSGPPGGPLLVYVRGYRNQAGDDASLARLAADLPLQQPVAHGSPTRIPLAGAERTALPLVAGESLGKTHWCLALVPAAPGGREGLLVTFGINAGAKTQPDCQKVLAHPSIAPVATSLQLR